MFGTQVDSHACKCLLGKPSSQNSIWESYCENIVSTFLRHHVYVWILKLYAKTVFMIVPDIVYCVCSAPCPARMVSCGANATRPCVPVLYLCDGYNDCGDNSDEEDCGELTTAIIIINRKHTWSSNLRKHQKMWKLPCLAILKNRKISRIRNSGCISIQTFIHLFLNERQPFHLICFKCDG